MLGIYGGLILLGFVLSWSDCIYEKAQIHSNKRTNEQESRPIYNMKYSDMKHSYWFYATEDVPAPISVW